MGQIRFGVWNMEWLNDLFVAGAGPAAFKPDQATVRGPHGATVASRKTSISNGLADLDLDALVVVEGPNRGDELQLLFDESHAFFQLGIRDDIVIGHGDDVIDFFYHRRGGMGLR